VRSTTILMCRGVYMIGLAMPQADICPPAAFSFALLIEGEGF